MVMSPVHQVLRKPSCKAQLKEEEDKADRGRDGKTTSGNGQRKRWEDNIREWTGLEFAKVRREVENREKWRKLVAKSFVVPQRPSRLRD